MINFNFISQTISLYYFCEEGFLFKKYVTDRLLLYSKKNQIILFKLLNTDDNRYILKKAYDFINNKKKKS